MKMATIIGALCVGFMLCLVGLSLKGQEKASEIYGKHMDLQCSVLFSVKTWMDRCY
jgi:hypothetical protein